MHSNDNVKRMQHVVKDVLIRTKVQKRVISMVIHICALSLVFIALFMLCTNSPLQRSTFFTVIKWSSYMVVFTFAIGIK
jgi:hypothetical protein